MADIRQFSKAVREMANYRKMPTAKLVEYEQYFVGQLGSFGSDPRAQIYEHQCQAQIESLRSAISRRWLAEQSERQYREAFGLGKKTLFWARLAVVAAVVVPVVLALISQLLSSKSQPSKTDTSNSPSSLQTPAPTAALSEPEEGSNSATPSPEPTAEITP